MKQYLGIRFKCPQCGSIKGVEEVTVNATAYADVRVVVIEPDEAWESDLETELQGIEGGTTSYRCKACKYPICDTAKGLIEVLRARDQLISSRPKYSEQRDEK